MLHTDQKMFWHFLFPRSSPLLMMWIMSHLSARDPAAFHVHDGTKSPCVWAEINIQAASPPPLQNTIIFFKTSRVLQF